MHMQDWIYNAHWINEHAMNIIGKEKKYKCVKVGKNGITAKLCHYSAREFWNINNGRLWTVITSRWPLTFFLKLVNYHSLLFNCSTMDRKTRDAYFERKIFSRKPYQRPLIVLKQKEKKAMVLALFPYCWFQPNKT